MSQEIPLEREDNLPGKIHRCLACPSVPLDKGDTPADGWMVGTLRRILPSGEKNLFEVRICPIHKLFTANHQPDLWRSDRRVVLARPERSPAKCRHCDLLLPEKKESRIGWAVAKLERWLPNKVIPIVFPLCPKHTLAAGNLPPPQLSSSKDIAKSPPRASVSAVSPAEASSSTIKSPSTAERS